MNTTYEISEMHTTQTQRAPRPAAMLTLVLSMILLAGCSRPMISGIFVSQMQSGLAMIRLVESPRGHLSGSFVSFNLDGDGSSKQDASFDVTGTISGHNVSLGMNGGLATLARWLGRSMNYVGTLDGKTLTLSAGNETDRFQEVSQARYDAMLAGLQQRGRHISVFHDANEAVIRARQEETGLNHALAQYTLWAQQRIDHVPNVRQFYANRLSHYSVCLNKILPLAASHVPAWQWQNCVLDTENDRYDLDQEAQVLRDDQSQNTKAVANLGARISTAPAQLTTALERLAAECAYAPNPDSCDRDVQTMRSMGPNGFLDSHLLSEFHSATSWAREALTTDSQISNRDSAKLNAIEQQIMSTYHASMGN